MSKEGLSSDDSRSILGADDGEIELVAFLHLALGLGHDIKLVDPRVASGSLKGCDTSTESPDVLFGYLS